MADTKVTSFPTLAQAEAEDILMIVDDPAGTPTSKKVTVGVLFGNVKANATFSGTFTANGTVTLTNLTVSANTIKIANTWTPASSSVAVGAGAIGYDENYLYVSVANGTIKRVALSTF